MTAIHGLGSPVAGVFGNESGLSTVKYVVAGGGSFEIIDNPRVSMAISTEKKAAGRWDDLKVSPVKLGMTSSGFEIAFRPNRWSVCRGFLRAMEEYDDVWKAGRPVEKGSWVHFRGPGILGVHAVVLASVEYGQNGRISKAHAVLARRDPLRVSFNPGCWSLSFEEQIDLVQSVPEQPAEATGRGLREEFDTALGSFKLLGGVFEPRTGNLGLVTVSIFDIPIEDLVGTAQRLGSRGENDLVVGMPLESPFIEQLRRERCFSTELANQCVGTRKAIPPGGLHPTTLARLELVTGLLIDQKEKI
ncbi:MAG: hypothetical protein DRR06_18265 [Gammaproteobacteria bacterium]|nr:MAG: hypothetical protein DRR06_18265 [Gammaproteobacteria bacterium]